MTKVVAIELKDGKLPDRKAIQQKLQKMIEGAINADGSWKKGWQPALLQCYIKKEGVGKYIFVHNLRRLDYSVAINLIKPPGGIYITDQGINSLSFETKDENQEYKDLEVRFAISINGD